MTLDELLTTRRSVRKFKSVAPPREMVKKLIDLAVTAPSASNRQPWRFFATDDAKLIARMAAAVQAGIDEIAPRIPERFAEMFLSYGDYFVRFRNAPVVVAPIFQSSLILSNLVGDAVSQERRDNISNLEFNSGIVSTSLAIGNLLLAAHEAGLGASCLTGPLVAARELKALLDVPESWHIACLVALGYPDETPEARPRKAADKVLRWVNS